MFEKISTNELKKKLVEAANEKKEIENFIKLASIEIANRHKVENEKAKTK